MKNLFRTLAFMTSLCALVSCTSDEIPVMNETSPEHPAPQTITALMPGATDTRVAYEETEGGGIEVLWKNSDKITLRSIENGSEHIYRYTGQMQLTKQPLNWNQAKGGSEW